MVELVTRNYWWPGVTKEMKQYVEGCDQCQRIKNGAEMPAEKLRPNKVPERPWQHISVDFITKLPVSKDYNSILVVCNRFSKMSHFVVTTKKIIAEGCLEIMCGSCIDCQRMWFVTGLMRELNKMLGIETKLSIAYHSQTDRQMERTNQELEQCLRMYIDYR